MTRQMKILIAEVIGTAILVIGGCGTAVLATGGVDGTGPSVGVLGVSFAFGLSLLVVAYSVGQISGGHVNPAVTIGLWAAGKTEGRDVPYYVVGQMVGSVIGALIVFIIANDVGLDFSTADPQGGGPGFATNGFDDRSPGGYGIPGMIVTEVVMTAFLLWAVLGTTTRRFAVAASGLSVGLALVLIHLISIPVTNTSVNPARSFGVAVFNGDALAQLWAFIVFPIIGAVAAALVWTAIHEDEPTDVEVV